MTTTRLISASKQFDKTKTSTWLQNRLDRATADLEKLTKQHKESKQELVTPVKDFTISPPRPARRRKHTLMSGLLSAACTDGDLRDVIISTAKVLKSQVKIVDMKFIQSRQQVYCREES